MPNLHALVQRMQDKPFTLLGINSYDEPDEYRDGVEEYDLNWPTIFQDNSAPISGLYRVQAYPTMYILDENGKIISKTLSGEALIKKVEELVAELEKKNK